MFKTPAQQPKEEALSNLLLFKPHRFYLNLIPLEKMGSHGWDPDF